MPAFYCHLRVFKWLASATGTVSPYTAPTAITRLLFTVIKLFLPGDRASQWVSAVEICILFEQTRDNMLICARKFDILQKLYEKLDRSHAKEPWQGVLHTVRISFIDIDSSGWWKGLDGQSVVSECWVHALCMIKIAWENKGSSHGLVCHENVKTSSNRIGKTHNHPGHPHTHARIHFPLCLYFSIYIACI